MLAVIAAIVGIVLVGAKGMDFAWGAFRSLSKGAADVVVGDASRSEGPVVPEKYE
jgi:hypothetical protein